MIALLDRLLGLGEHARFRARPPRSLWCFRLGDHIVDDAMAVVTGLDTVDFAGELVLVGAEIGEALPPASATYCGTTVPARCARFWLTGLNRAVVGVGFDVCGHARHPVAEEHVDVFVLLRRA